MSRTIHHHIKRHVLRYQGISGMYFIQFAKTEQVSRRNKETTGYISQLPPIPHLFNPFLLVYPLVSLSRGQKQKPSPKRATPIQNHYQKKRKIKSRTNAQKQQDPSSG